MTVKEQVFTVIQTNPGITRTEISKLLKIRHSSTTGRVRELLEAGLIYVNGEAFDTSSNRTVQTLEAV